jgi:hypothetical protein
VSTQQVIGSGNGRIGWSLFSLFFTLVLRAGLADLRRRLLWVGVAILAVALVSIGLFLSAARSTTGSL